LEAGIYNNPMSLQDIYKNAGVVMKPAAMKDGKLYSQQPHSGAGDFNFSRADGVQTRINKHGLIETVANNEPRLSYDLIDGEVSDCPTLLLEPSRTNLITDYTGVGFSVFNGASITANDSVSPDGSKNATLMTTTGGANQLIQQAGIGISSGQLYTISGYFKLKSGTLTDNDNALKGLDGFNGGITGSTFNSSITSEWQRLSFTITSTTTSGRVQMKCEDGAEILIWGLQVELGSYVTSVIPTSGSTEIRQADICNGSGNSETFNDSEGVLFAEIAALGTDGVTKRLAISNSSNSYIVRLEFRPTVNQIYGVVYLSPSNMAVLTHTVSDWAEFNKVAIKYKQNDFAMWINGVEVATDPLGSTGTGLDDFSFDSGSGGNDWYGKVKELSVFNEALTDEHLQLLTTP
jgi:hypothetical protein